MAMRRNWNCVVKRKKKRKKSTGRLAAAAQYTQKRAATEVAQTADAEKKNTDSSKNNKKKEKGSSRKRGASETEPPLDEGSNAAATDDACKKFDKIIQDKRQEFAKAQKVRKASLALRRQELEDGIQSLGTQRYTMRKRCMMQDELENVTKELENLLSGKDAIAFEKKINAFDRERRRIEERAPAKRKRKVAKKVKRNSEEDGTAAASASSSSKKSASSTRRRSAGHKRTIHVSTADQEYDGGLDVLTQEMQDAFESNAGDRYGMLPSTGEERAIYVALMNVCPRCDVLMQKLTAESVMACPQCGVMCPYVDGTAASTSHTDERSFSSFAYSRAGHFQSWLRTIQAKETATIPQEILTGVCMELAKLRVREEDVTPARVREALKAMKKRKYYENSVLICSLLTGKKPMRFSPEVEKTLEELFLKIQEPFRIAKEALQPERKNFLSYPYVAWKLLELLDAESVDKRWLSRFPKLKGRDKLAKSDVLWASICKQLGWKYKPSA